MNNYWENKLQRLWMIISAVSLLLPFLLNYAEINSANFNIAITAILAVLFAFSLPFSIFALPLMAMFRYGIELDMGSMFGTYFFIVLLNAFGYLQWFWLMLKYFNRGKDFTLPTIMEGN